MYRELGTVLDSVGDEVRRQVKLKEEGKFKYTPADLSVPEGQKFAMLCEEVGEVATNLLSRAGNVTDGDPSNEAMVHELTQVAAIAVAWITSYQKEARHRR